MIESCTVSALIRWNERLINHGMMITVQESRGWPWAVPYVAVDRRPTIDWWIALHIYIALVLVNDLHYIGWQHS